MALQKQTNKQTNKTPKALGWILEYKFEFQKDKQINVFYVIKKS